MKKFADLRFLYASFLGTYLEFLDFTLFVAASAIMAHRFFPQNSQVVNLICTWGIFAVSFIARPFGAIFFGFMGDKFGGRGALLLSMGLMSVCTTLIGCLPTYQSIGLYAPMSLMILRLLQGFAVSPEFSGAATYLSLKKFKVHFGLKCSLTNAASTLGMISGGLWMAYLSRGYSIETLPEWRWRLPFILSGLVLGMAGLWLRLNMGQGRSKTQVHFPLWNLLKTQKKEMALAISLAAYVGITYYGIFAYTASFLQKYRGFVVADSLQTVGLATLIAIPVTLYVGHLSDKIGPLKILKTAALMMLANAGLGVYSLLYGNYLGIYLGLMLLASCEAAFSAVVPAYLSTLFKAEHRYSGTSFSYSIGIAIAGGTSPLLMTLLTPYSNLMPGFILSMAALGILGVLRLYHVPSGPRLSKGLLLAAE